MKRSATKRQPPALRFEATSFAALIKQIENQLRSEAMMAVAALGLPTGPEQLKDALSAEQEFWAWKCDIEFHLDDYRDCDDSELPADPELARGYAIEAIDWLLSEPFGEFGSMSGPDFITAMDESRRLLCHCLPISASAPENHR